MAIELTLPVMQSTFPTAEHKLVAYHCADQTILREPFDLAHIARVANTTEAVAAKCVGDLKSCRLLGPSVRPPHLALDPDRLALLAAGEAQFLLRDDELILVVDAGALEAQRAARHEARLLELSLRYDKKPIPKRLRLTILARDAFRCRHCGATDELQIDHIYPERRGGTLDPNNLQTLCRPCNLSKGARV